MEEVGNAQPKEVASQQEPVVKKDGGSKGLIIGMVALVIVALAGIGFGVWGMMAKDQAEKNLANCSSNTSEDKDDGDVENESSDEPAECKTDTTTDSTNSVSPFSNPIIASKISGEKDEVYYVGNTVDSSTSDSKSIEIFVENGSISKCRIDSKECKINGISGDIYKVVSFGEGLLDGSNIKIGFIMKDGTVKYLNLPYSYETELNAAALNISGYVVDIVSIYVSTEGGGKTSSMFIMNDGSYVKFSEDMLK